MFSIRFHGRGGQGMKTASRILGAAFFHAGFEVQDAPRYGAERRGAPMFAYVRADRQPIDERGIIRRPNLVVVADDSLVPIAAAGVLIGIRSNTVVVINSQETADVWSRRLNLISPLMTFSAAEPVSDRTDVPLTSAFCAGAAACLVGVIELDTLTQAVREELADLGPDVVKRNRRKAVEGYEQMQDQKGVVAESAAASAHDYTAPAWIELPTEHARVSAPTIHAALTSTKVKTGLWRTLRPVIDYDRCNRCWWVCSSSCPDSVIAVSKDGSPAIDYDYCKGCMLCVVQCPAHAIEAIPEAIARDQQAAGATP